MYLLLVAAVVAVAALVELKHRIIITPIVFFSNDQ